MIPWVQLGKAPVPGGGEVRLMRRGAEFSIRLGVKELMNSRLSGSEEALATLACARIQGRQRPRVLIGGLGMGFTLRAALGALSADARIEVAELIPAVAQWAESEMAEIFAGSLRDPRVRLELTDVAELIGARGAAPPNRFANPTARGLASAARDSSLDTTSNTCLESPWARALRRRTLRANCSHKSFSGLMRPSRCVAKKVTSVSNWSSKSLR